MTISQHANLRVSRHLLPLRAADIGMKCQHPVAVITLAQHHDARLWLLRTIYGTERQITKPALWIGCASHQFRPGGCFKRFQIHWILFSSVSAFSHLAKSVATKWADERSSQRYRQMRPAKTGGQHSGLCRE
uniref:Uncharacterized protein n=1 Tax=Enterobacter agglomerans TaxID=549 RepID=D7GL55_ENTAG|nr:hypothetical protein [Pantoea agglomerans]